MPDRCHCKRDEPSGPSRAAVIRLRPDSRPSSNLCDQPSGLVSSEALSCYNRRVCARVRGNGGRGGPLHPLLCRRLLNAAATGWFRSRGPGCGRRAALWSSYQLPETLEIRKHKIRRVLQIYVGLAPRGFTPFLPEHKPQLKQPP